MSSVSSTSNSNSYYYAMQKKTFDKLDSDENANLSEKEFLAGKPKDVKKNQAAAIYEALDTNKSDSVTMDEFAAGTQFSSGVGLLNQLSSSALDVLMQLSQQDGMISNGAAGSRDSASDAAYDALDTNKDGMVSQDEFLVAYPKQISDNEAKTLFERLETDKSGALSKEQLSGFMNTSLLPRLMTSPSGGTTSDPSIAYSLLDALDSDAEDTTTFAT